MVPGSIADYLEAAGLAGLMYGLAASLWAATKNEAREKSVETRLASQVSTWRAAGDQLRPSEYRSAQRVPAHSRQETFASAQGLDDGRGGWWLYS